MLPFLLFSANCTFRGISIDKLSASNGWIYASSCASSPSADPILICNYNRAQEERVFDYLISLTARNEDKLCSSTRPH